MKRTENNLDAKQVLSVIEKYSLALDLLDDYDHQTMKRPAGNKAVYVLSYEECRKIIDTILSMEDIKAGRVYSADEVETEMHLSEETIRICKKVFTKQQSIWKHFTEICF